MHCQCKGNQARNINTLPSPHTAFAARAASQPLLRCCDFLTILNRLGYFKFVGCFTWKIFFWVKALKLHSCCLLQGKGDVTNYLGIHTEPTGDSVWISTELWHKYPASTDRQSLLGHHSGDRKLSQALCICLTPRQSLLHPGCMKIQVT